MDADKDGKVSRAEFDASGERVFARGNKALTAAGEDAGSDRRQPTGRSRNRLSMARSDTGEGFLALIATSAHGQGDKTEFASERVQRSARTDGNRAGAHAKEE